MTLYIDTRWQGSHGIARYAYEVSRRLSVDFEPLKASRNPSSPFDVISMGRLRLGARDTVYSPGYNAGMTKAKQLVTLHDLIHLGAAGYRSMLLRTYYDAIVKPAVVRAGSVFTVSQTSEDLIRNWLKRDDVEVLNVGNGCSDVFYPRSTLSGDERYFLYVGNLKAHKNFSVLLSALQLNTDAKLVAVINDTEKAKMLVESVGLSGRVQIISGLTDAALADYYRGSIGLLMPSLIEGFGLPAVESLACGRPVAYSAECASVAEIVQNWGVAVYDQLSPEAWAEAMEALQAGSDTYQAPDQSWRDQYSWERVADNVNNHLHLISADI